MLLDKGIDAVGVGGEDALAVGVVARPLRVVHRSPVHHQPRSKVIVKRRGPEDLREPSLAPPAPHLQLPQPVLGHDVSLREKEVLGVLGIDVRHAPRVPHDLDLLP